MKIFGVLFDFPRLIQTLAALAGIALVGCTASLSDLPARDQVNFNQKIPKIKSSTVKKVVNPSLNNPAAAGPENLYGTLDMMDLVRIEDNSFFSRVMHVFSGGLIQFNTREIIVLAHEIFPNKIPGKPGDLGRVFPDEYDGANTGLGQGAVTGWDRKTGHFFFILSPKNTTTREKYDEDKHTSGTDGVRATPWGTALIAEEWSQNPDLQKGIPARAGHIIEVNPANPGAISRIKAMGAFAHEGIAIRETDDNIEIFQGDENQGGKKSATWLGVPGVLGFSCMNGVTPRRGGALYKFVPSQKPREFGDLKANGGKLFAFDFELRRWVLVPAPVVEANDPQVIRCWADQTLSPVSLWERPEDIEIDPKSGYLYFSVTEKSCEVIGATCDLATADRFNGAANNDGHVVRLNPDNGNWTIFVDAATANPNIVDPKFKKPDNLVIDRKGRVYITQDGGAASDSIWIATPDNDGDGVADKFQRFLNMTSANLGVAANTGEPTGFLFLNDQTLLFNFQGKIRPGDFDGLPESRIMVIQLHDPREE